MTNRPPWSACWPGAWTAPATRPRSSISPRGWFGLAEPEPGRLMCLLPPAPPRQALAPYEVRATLHLARRAAGRGEVPAAALTEGFADGQAAFAEAFHDEVVADARRRGLTRPTLRARTSCDFVTGTLAAGPGERPPEPPDGLKAPVTSSLGPWPPARGSASR